MNLDDYRKLTGQTSTASKYHNIKTEADGIAFDSKLEAKRYRELQMLQRAGEIQGFALQPSFLFSSGVRYRPDFIICGKDGQIYCEDAKGHKTKEFIIKQKIWESEYPWMQLRIVE